MTSQNVLRQLITAKIMHKNIMGSWFILSYRKKLLNIGTVSRAVVSIYDSGYFYFCSLQLDIHYVCSIPTDITDRITDETVITMNSIDMIDKLLLTTYMISILNHTIINHNVVIDNKIINHIIINHIIINHTILNHTIIYHTIRFMNEKSDLQ